MPDLRGWIRRRRYGGVTGLNQMDATGRMAAVAGGPLLAGIFLIQVIAMPDDLRGMLVLGLLIGEVVWIAALMMKARTDATPLIPFPQAHIFFPDGQVKWFDFKIQPGGIVEKCTYPDESKGYEIELTDRFEVVDQVLRIPRIFNRVLMRVPTEFAEAFKRLAQGEFFFENVFVPHSSCDALTYFVKEWLEIDGETLPVGQAVNTSFDYMNWLKGEKTKTGLDLFMVARRKLQEANKEYIEQNQLLETTLEIERSYKGKGRKEQIDRTLSTVRDGVHDIEDTSEPIFNRIFRLRTLGIILVILGLIIASHFLLGWP